MGREKEGARRELKRKESTALSRIDAFRKRFGSLQSYYVRMAAWEKRKARVYKRTITHRAHINTRTHATREQGCSDLVTWPVAAGRRAAAAQEGWGHAAVAARAQAKRISGAVHALGSTKGSDEDLSPPTREKGCRAALMEFR